MIVCGVLWFHVGFRASVHPSVSHSFVCRSVLFSFLDDNLSKHQWIFTKLGMCIDIVEIWFGIANGLMGKFCQIFTKLSACDMTVAGYYSLTFLFILHLG